MVVLSYRVRESGRKRERERERERERVKYLDKDYGCTVYLVMFGDAKSSIYGSMIL